MSGTRPRGPDPMTPSLVAMDSALALLAALAATLFAGDLWLDYRRRPRPHIAAYGVGMTMFAVATWAFFIGLSLRLDRARIPRLLSLRGDSQHPVSRPGLDVPGRRQAIRARNGDRLGAFTAISTTLTATVPFANPLPESGRSPRRVRRRVRAEAVCNHRGRGRDHDLGGPRSGQRPSVLEEESKDRLGEPAHPRRDSGRGIRRHRSGIG